MHTCVTYWMGHICRIFSTHLGHIFYSIKTIESHEYEARYKGYSTSYQHIRCFDVEHMWPTSDGAYMSHILHTFSTHFPASTDDRTTRTCSHTDEHVSILPDYITPLQHVRCSYMDHMCYTSDGTYMPHIYHTYCTHLLL